MFISDKLNLSVFVHRLWVTPERQCATWGHVTSRFAREALLWRGGRCPPSACLVVTCVLVMSHWCVYVLVSKPFSHAALSFPTRITAAMSQPVDRFICTEHCTEYEQSVCGWRLFLPVWLWFSTYRQRFHWQFDILLKILTIFFQVALQYDPIL